ncbi:DUF4333 domain-containing protein [Aquihabitans sp. McL0605]|uniref:DUF4333 domain-containing protein n=1 Tax=Aquihabitans sp. McL0605 TaxID=3415671 RepID=UPI003CF9232C
MRRTGAAMVLAVGLLVAAAACSDSASTLDQAATERAVGRSVAAKVEPAVKSTTCPADLPKGTGRTFECRIVLGSKAGTLRVTVRQTDDRGTLRVTPLAAVVSSDQVAAKLSASLAKQFGRKFLVDCRKGGFEVRAPRSTSTCSAADLTSKRSVTVTVVDPSGTLSFTVKPAQAK